MPGSQGKAYRRGTRRTHDSGRCGQMFPRKKVHVAPLPSTEAIRMTKEFSNEKYQIQPPHNQRRCPPMIQGHSVAIFKLHHRSCDNCLLSGAQVHLTGNPAFVPQLGDRFFKQPTPEHILVQNP
jgi:hypothetical protein